MRRLSSRFIPNAFLALAALALPGMAQAQFKVLYTFKGGSDGSGPAASLIMDSAGNLYGTTAAGGAYGYGTVFRLAAGGSEAVLYSFKAGTDGANPEAGLTMDASGNLFGTTSAGGTSDGCEGQGCGTIFELAAGGTESVLHVFAGGSDGAVPMSGLIMDKSGNFYGTTIAGGSQANCDYLTGCGTVYRLGPNGHERVLYAFQGSSDGGNPSGSLAMDKAGNLYGTTEAAGSGQCISGCGVVFKVAKDGTETVLHAFQYSDGSDPVAGVIMDKAGNLYGTTAWGGSVEGTAFKLAPDGTETVLHNFTDRPDGATPAAGLVMDKGGNLYGTTQAGGRTCGNFGSSCGTVFRIAPDGSETVLHAFRRSTGDGILPVAGLIGDAHGNLYGTTPALTWQKADGTVFEITP